MNPLLSTLEGLDGRTFVLCALSLALIVAIGIACLKSILKPKKRKADFGAHHLRDFPWEAAKASEQDRYRGDGGI